MIPKDWQVEKMEDIATISSGGTPSRTNPNYWDGDIPWITTTQVDSNVIREAQQYITREGMENSAARMLPTGTLLMALYGQGKTRGKVAMLGISAATNQACASILISDPVLARFTFNYLTNQYEAIRASSNGGSQNNLTGGIVKRLHIPIPPQVEQTRITSALFDIDTLISSLDQLIAKKRDIQQATMQQLLTGQCRLPGFSGEWEVKRLGDCLLTKPDYGINAPAVAYSDALPTYIRITDINDDGYFAPLPKVSVDSPMSCDYLLEEGDVVFARTGASVGKSYRYRTDDGLLVFAGFLIRVRPNQEKLTPAFLAASVTTESYWNWVRLMSMRSGQPGINSNEYANLPLLLPNINEQTAIATILSDMDTELAALEARRDKARLIKQGMMQELLTGRIRLM
ncbi:restriction endonuclease subunit S [Pseudomonas protegens]|uniref:restriction endonuclease subunit S n=1 Tax=Pseudomonas protegens TaxID=380021 RepID=UPI002937181A|nr:restriction endonuclease subunit S [Pseudomonas protegens]WOE79962.1 restriction endonuclease subunit S [Pseudomonas protegens]